ncbi:MAG: sugar transferase, partial [Prochlorococcaceae cyanobacterium]
MSAGSAYRRLKGLLDRLVALVALVALAPLLLAIAALVRWHLGRPVLFRQRRAGLGGRPFVLVKFRTMTEAVDASGRPLADGRRLTRLGRQLRRLSLDELPELLNILRGEMSFVGPRPLLLEYLPLYSPEQARRHQVRPGLSGWAQVNGRNSLSWDRKFALDVWYVDHQNLALDLRILWRTVVVMLRADGIHAEAEATMAPFRGTVAPRSAEPSPP